MRKEAIFIDVWVVSYFNALDGSHRNTIHSTCNDAISDFSAIANEAINFASDKMSDFRVIRNVNTLTIYDAEDDRMVISCEALAHTIQCGTMYM
jgi:hypothetical protein